VTAPLRLSFDIACSAEHAFSVWTTGIGTWWPPDHTVTGQAELVVLQSGVGGRIYERTADGGEHDWGEVTVWQPPAKLAYRWHLGGDRRDATEVEIRFLARGPDATTIEIEHRGWERLGAAGEQWRARNQIGWQTLLPHFLAAITVDGDHEGDG
jgi:Activator of Hsp90 ATPase homolog 1-like protein